MPDLALDQQRAQPLYLTSPRLTEAGLPHLFTTRHFPGVTSPRDPGSPFDADALRLLAELDLHAGPPAFLRQVHGADVLAAERAGLVGRADVVVTDRPGLPLAIFTADCVPLVLYDPVGRRLALAHAGWRGTAAAAARAAAGALIAAGGAPETLRRRDRPVDRTVLLRGRRAGHRAVRCRVSRGLAGVGDGGGPRQVDAGSVAGQCRPAPDGRARSGAHRQPGALHLVPRRSLLLVSARAGAGTARGRRGAAAGPQSHARTGCGIAVSRPVFARTGRVNVPSGRAC